MNVQLACRRKPQSCIVLWQLCTKHPGLPGDQHGLLHGHGGLGTPAPHSSTLSSETLLRGSTARMQAPGLQRGEHMPGT